ncbi:MAG: 1-phosphofructokinase family hexose kinase [Phycisphaerae bacterium]|nr:1-phosphofructokinase family hexose kinase [Phycisphaerae bacterium]
MKFDPIVTVTMNPAIDRMIAVDKFEVGGHQLGREVARIAGGKGVNVSKALARLGAASVATGFLGRDNSRFFESMLMAQSEQPLCRRINLQFFEVPGLTRENVTILDSASGVETHVRDLGPGISDRDLLRLKRKLDLMSRPGSLVIFGGGLPPGVDGESFSQIVRICEAAGARVAVDTSEAALGAVRDEKLFLVKPNRHELAQLLGRDVGPDRGEIVKAGRELAGRFDYVLISLGAEGGLAFHEQTAIAGRVPIDPDRIVSTVGCGDCLLAGFVAGLTAGKDLVDAYRLALAAATANLLGGGAAEFKPESLDEFLAVAQTETL